MFQLQLTLNNMGLNPQIQITETFSNINILIFQLKRSKVILNRTIFCSTKLYPWISTNLSLQQTVVRLVNAMKSETLTHETLEEYVSLCHLFQVFVQMTAFH